MSTAPSIPIRSLYFMLSYAWGSGQRLPTETASNEVERLKTPQSLVAWWLANEHQRLARRGLVRGYVGREEMLGTVRGTIDVGRMARTLASPMRLPCRYDELDQDTWLNRRVARALRLAARGDFDPEAYEAVRRSLRGLGDIGDEGPVRHRGRLRLRREERHYKVALALSDIILRFAVPHERKGGDEVLDFRDFTRDPRWGGALFERFLSRVIERGQERYRPHSTRPEHLARAKDGHAHARALLPTLRTDICLTDTTLIGPNRIVAVIETKFYAAPLARSQHGAHGRLRAAHLAQLYMYLKVLAERGEPVTTGLLIYAAAGGEPGFDVEYTIDGFRLVARTVPLDASPQEVIDDVLSLLGRVGP